MARLLLLEDDQSLIDGLVYALTKEGFALDVAMTVREARAQLASQAYDLLLLDQTLPDGSGLALCEEVRAGGNAVPIIFLTAMDEEIQVIRALDAGGDDYITKPFKLGELCSRIRAQLRRSGMLRQQEQEPGAEGTVRIEGGRAYREEEPLELTATELRLLACFLRNRGTGADAGAAARCALGRGREFCRRQHAVGLHPSAARKGGTQSFGAAAFAHGARPRL